MTVSSLTLLLWGRSVVYDRLLTTVTVIIQLHSVQSQTPIKQTQGHSGSTDHE